MNIIDASTRGKLTVHVVSGRGLKAQDSNGLSDPYCIVKPWGAGKKRTRCVKHTLNPVWDEKIVFTGGLATFCKEPLQLRVFDRDLLTLNDPIGEASLPLHRLGKHDLDSVARITRTLDLSGGGCLLYTSPSPRDS